MPTYTLLLLTYVFDYWIALLRSDNTLAQQNTLYTYCNQCGGVVNAPDLRSGPVRVMGSNPIAGILYTSLRI